MNVGGDPGRDDYGLPPVDVVIPDDARELDRDVQAYQRELRAMRRRQRARRLRGPLTRDGMVLPLLAGCLILALVTSTLLIMFAANQTGMPSSSGLPPASSFAKHHRPQPVRRPPAAGQPRVLLPATVIVIGGRHVSVRAITAAGPTVLALIPLVCTCVPALHQLRVQAAQAHVALYLVGTGGDQKQVALLAEQAGQTRARVAEDVNNVLGRTYTQLGLTAIMVRRGGTVDTVVRDISPSRGQNLAASLRQLVTAGR